MGGLGVKVQHFPLTLLVVLTTLTLPCERDKESWTLNLAQRSFNLIDFGTNRKRVYIFLLVVGTNLDPILHRFRDTAA